MTERKQPVCMGMDKRGELIWGAIPMPLWQQAMFPLRYCGDFITFWIRLTFYEKMGLEPDAAMPSMDLRAWKTDKKQRFYHSGD